MQSALQNFAFYPYWGVYGMLAVDKLMYGHDKKNTASPKFHNKSFSYTFNRPTFGMAEITNFLSLLDWIDVGNPFRLPLKINLGKISFDDKLSYILLECLCYYALQYKHQPISILLNAEADIVTDGILDSPLNLLKSSHPDNKRVFLAKFKQDIGKRHYRRIIDVSETIKNPFFVSSLVSDVANFLKPYDVAEKYRNELAEVIGELIDNSIEHANADCLFDLDISREFTKTTTGESFLGVNVTVMNLSDRLLGEPIKKKLQNSTILNPRDHCVRNALHNHKALWNSNYSEEDFYNIASFQDRISGRNEITVTGGTGLTKLISSLEKTSDTYRCFVVSGQRKLSFLHKFLEYNQDGWIGFNQEKNFLDAPPDASTIDWSPIYIQGTAYNLCFAMKKEEATP